MKNKFLWLCLFFGCIWSTDAQTIVASYKKGFVVTAERWQVVDVIFKASLPTNQNPFDVTFGADFTSGKENVKVYGFFNGDDKWVIRFSASSPGEWRFKTFASVQALSSLEGALTIVQNTRPNQNGAVRIDPRHPQAFVYEDGTPHFMLAFEADWLFALDYDNQNGTPKTDKLLEAVKSNGFTQVVMNVYAYDVGWKISNDVPPEYFYGRPAYSPFGGDNENPDFTTLNFTFFQHLDRVVSRLQNIGLEAHLMIYVWNKEVNWPPMYSSADNRYFDYIIARYQAFSNVIWDVSKEALDYGRCDIPYINERIERIRTRDAYKRLITVHDYEYNSRESNRVDFISIQSWRSNLYSLMLQARQTHASKPVVNIEHGGYEAGPYFSFRGNYESAETCLSRAYECVFAGVYGSYYWQDAAWNIVIHDPLNEKHKFDKPRFDYYRHLQGLFRKYPYNNFRPSYPKLTTNSRIGENNLATNGFALTSDNGSYLMMIPSESERVNLVFEKPASGKFRATWFNPFSGEYREAGVVNWTGWNEFVKPWSHFGILILEEV